MAEPQKSEDLRREILGALDSARAEMSAQAAELRHDLNPAEVVRNAFDKHPVGAVAAAAGAGLMIGWLLLRRRPAPSPPEYVSPVATPVRQSIAARVFGSLVPVSLLGPVASMAVKAALPYLMKAGLKYYQEKHHPKPNFL